MSRPRVVITGVSGVTPLANDIDSTWKRLLSGESGIGPITAFDASAYPCRVAGEVKNSIRKIICRPSRPDAWTALPSLRFPRAGC